MSFPEEVKRKALVSCGRKCCICHKFCGNNMEIHHIRPHAQGGGDTFENAIPLCFDCHAEVGQYNPLHPKGTKFTEKELICHRDNWYHKVKEENISINKQTEPEPVRIYKTKDSEPDGLISVSSGKELLSYARESSALEYDYDEPETAEELNKLMEFSNVLEFALDEIPYISLSQKMALAFQLTSYINELDKIGYMIFTNQANRILKGGISTIPDNFPVWIVHVLKKNNPQILSKENITNETYI